MNICFSVLHGHQEFISNSMYLLKQESMNVWILVLALAGIEVATSIPAIGAIYHGHPTCVPFSAIFLAVIDQTIDTASPVIDDPGLSFFRDIMMFRDNTIQHTINDAINFFNETYGLDFSLSPPNDQNEYFYENAKLSPFRLPHEKIDYMVTFNNWIQSGSTRSSCYRIRDGGFQVTFPSGDQLLRGSYGGDDGVLATVTDVVTYGFYNIDVCQQSPVIIQYQSSAPISQESADKGTFFTLDLYNRVLGHGKAIGSIFLTPDISNPGQFRVVSRNVYTFPAN